MKCPFLLGVLWTMSSETLKSRSLVRKFSIKPPRGGGGGGLFFSSAFERGLEREGEGAYSI